MMRLRQESRSMPCFSSTGSALSGHQENVDGGVFLALRAGGECRSEGGVSIFATSESS